MFHFELHCEAPLTSTLVNMILSIMCHTFLSVILVDLLVLLGSEKGVFVSRCLCGVCNGDGAVECSDGSLVCDASECSVGTTDR